MRLIGIRRQAMERSIQLAKRGLAEVDNRHQCRSQT
jgi:hypothetical protein